MTIEIAQAILGTIAGLGIGTIIAMAMIIVASFFNRGRKDREDG